MTPWIWVVSRKMISRFDGRMTLLEPIWYKQKPLSWDKGFSESERRGSNSRHPPLQDGGTSF